jgi:methionyl-tRNA formyltransferase
VPVRTPATLRSAEAQAEFRAHAADAAVVVAYGLILPQDILAVPRLGCFNVHASLLPRWRGAAPINRAIMAGDKESGISIMKMDEGLDTGPIAREKHVRFRSKVYIPVNMTAGELHDILMRLGAEQMLLALDALERGTLKTTPQQKKDVPLAKKISNEQTRIDWTKTWKHVRDHIRGLSPFPAAWFELNGVRVKALRASRGVRGKRKSEPGTVLDDKLSIACGAGAVRLIQVQRAGARAMAAEEFLRGMPLKVGTSLK